jgi:Family of unknown function (DUF5682)
VVAGVPRGIARLDQDQLRREWQRALGVVAEQPGVHGLVAGRATRLLLDAALIDVTEAGRRLSLRLSPAADAVAAAGWLDGFLSGEAALLVHEPELLAVVDRWATGVDGEVFDHLLPLLRRTFADFAAAERRAIGTQVARLDRGVTSTAAAEEEDVDHERAARVLPKLLEILG